MMMNREPSATISIAGISPPHGRLRLFLIRFPPNYYYKRKEVADPLRLFVGTKIIKKSVTSL